MEDDKNIQIDLNSLDQLIDKLANKDKQIEFDFFDFNHPSTISTAANITQATSGNIWPYVLTGSSSTGTSTTYSLSNGIGGYNSNLSSGLTFNDFYDNNGRTNMSVKGDAEFEGDVKIKGKSLNAILDKIEERLAILHPNAKLEDKWEKLKELGNQYRALEKDILEKEKIWNILKK